MFAVIKTGGKQYLVQEGDLLNVEKLVGEAGTKCNLETLLIAKEDGSDVKLGTPSLGENVSVEIISHGLGEKVSVVKYKAKSHYHRRVGHRQAFTKIKITKIA
ncbi:50S ribosomal protein L21 [Candidatus Uhrbacteria bacterium]|nr:50S ribosomal protein L21 [Candidatus Uhrbacteria bacterium]